MLTQAAPSRARKKEKPALLFVDDERRVLTSMRAMFRREYDVLLANSGHEAIEILETRDDVHVVVSDQRMPEMTGVELLATVKDDYPSSMRILLTGYADLDAVEASINESEVFRYLMKPCPTDELKDAVRLAVQAARVSEMAGVAELAAVPDEELEKIELTPVVEEPAEALALETAGDVEESVGVANGIDVSYADVADVDVSAVDARWAQALAGDDHNNPQPIEPASFSASDSDAAEATHDAADEIAEAENGLPQDSAAESAEEFAEDVTAEAAGTVTDDTASAPADTDGLDDALQDTIADAQQAGDESIAVERPDPEVLVLTHDSDLLEGVSLAIGPQYAVREADSIDSALRMLSEHPVGVLITDLAVNESEIDELTRTLKHEVPELVTIIASERSDAALLIGLINHGQIFRFLLKPLQVAQTRIWLNSAMAKYDELCADKNTVLRHRVARNTEVEAVNSGLFANVRARIKTIKARFASSLLTGLTGDRGE